MSQSQSALRKPPTLLALTLPLVLAGMVAAAIGARAADWVERPFAPPLGSRWIIQSDDTTEDSRDGHPQTSVTRSTSELTIERKIADGFAVTYVTHDATYEGDARTAALIGPITKALTNVIIHATTAANGTPLRVENLDEVLTHVRSAIDNMTMPSTGQAAAVFRSAATKMLIADDKQAPRIYLASLATLALGQNTGLRPGETRRFADEVTNPLSGAPIKSDVTLRIDSADPATGNVRLIRTRAFDSDAIKDFFAAMAHRLGLGGNDQQKLDEFLKKFAIALDSRADIEVEGGMTRTVREDDTATVTMPGHSVIKHGHKLLTVTPAP